MAEVRKKVLEDKYNTNSIKTSTKNKEEKKAKVKTVKKATKQKKSNEKKGFFNSFRVFFRGVKSEFHKIHWPEKKDMIKNSIATIFFIVFFSLFFYVINVLFALVKSLF